jgi:hypothetical protein
LGFLDGGYELGFLFFVDKLLILWINCRIIGHELVFLASDSVDNANCTLCFLPREKQEPVDKSRIEL